MFFQRKEAGGRLPMAKAQKRLESDPSIFVLDVRTEEEYREGHIPGSRNLPLDGIGGIAGIAPDKRAALFLYCHSGARSAMAARLLAGMGYTNVWNIGGIVEWDGKIEGAVGA